MEPAETTTSPDAQKVSSLPNRLHRTSIALSGDQLVKEEVFADQKIQKGIKTENGQINITTTFVPVPRKCVPVSRKKDLVF